MIPESYLTLWGSVDIFILALAKVYVFKSLAGMLGKLKIHEGFYNILCSILIIAAILIQTSKQSIILLFIIGVTCICIVLAIAYDASPIQRWIVVVSWVSIMVVVESFVDSMMYGIYYLGICNQFLEMRIIYSVGNIVKTILFIQQINIYKRLEICVVNGRWAGSATLLSLVINAISIVLVFWYLRKSDVRVELFSGALVAITLGLLLANIAIVISASRLAKFYESEMEQREVQKRSEAEYEYYSRLEEEQERIRMLYHDINNHIACIKEVAKEQEELTTYIHALEKEVQTTRQTYKTGCSVVDAILRQKSIICEKKQIDLKVNVDLSCCGFMEAKDLCSMFANALDNAIEACEKIGSSYATRYIYMESQVTKGFLVIKIKNSKEHMNKWINEILVTQKQDKKLHGLGLRNIKRALEKYEGEYIIKEETYEFYLKLVIPLQSLKCN